VRLLHLRSGPARRSPTPRRTHAAPGCSPRTARRSTARTDETLSRPAPWSGWLSRAGRSKVALGSSTTWPRQISNQVTSSSPPHRSQLVAPVRHDRRAGDRRRWTHDPRRCRHTRVRPRRGRRRRAGHPKDPGRGAHTRQRNERLRRDHLRAHVAPIRGNPSCSADSTRPRRTAVELPRGAARPLPPRVRTEPERLDDPAVLAQGGAADRNRPGAWPASRENRRRPDVVGISPDGARAGPSHRRMVASSDRSDR
jgi:hypothetical protein